MKPNTKDRLGDLQAVIETVHRLRAPDGCPWDRAQTHQSLRPHLVEEAYEVLDVLDRIGTAEDLKKPEILASFKEEMGDLLMQILLHSEMTREAGAFDIFDVAKGLNEKLISRHPHVFGDEKVAHADAALKTWEKQKAKEKEKNPNASVLDGIPQGLPALQRAAKVIDRVTKVGFQWKDFEGPIDKVHEELEELKSEIRAMESESDQAEKEKIRARVEYELGDALFTLANLGFLSKINPEASLRGMLGRFESRFKHIEKRLKEQGKSPEKSTLEEMDRYWDEAKRLEKGQK